MYRQNQIYQNQSYPNSPYSNQLYNIGTIRNTNRYSNGLSQQRYSHQNSFVQDLQQKRNLNYQQQYRQSHCSQQESVDTQYNQPQKISSSKLVTKRFQNGDYYQGNTFKGMKHGQGIFVKTNGETYQGNWCYNEKQGYGVMNDNINGIQYQGNWDKDLYEGQGKLKMINGDVYVGMFSQGQFNGYGIYYTSNGETLEGLWANGILYQQYNKNQQQNYQRSNFQQDQNIIDIQRKYSNENNINEQGSSNVNGQSDIIKDILQMNEQQIQDNIVVQQINNRIQERDDFKFKLEKMLNNKLNKEEILDFIRLGIRGRYNLIKTQFGYKLRLYADYTASGQDIVLVDKMMQFIQEIYSNTHTESSHDGKVMNKIFHDAQKIILKCCNADPKEYSVISVGSGCTGAIELAQKILGTYIAPKTMQRLEQIFTLKEIKQKLRQKKQLPLILITSYEHHSNEITWKKQLCDVQVIPLTKDGYFNIQQLENILINNINKYKEIICSFSAGSNVTGIKTDIQQIKNIIKKYNVILLFDYAGVGPYIKIDMQDIHGIYLSPHKFLGGPGSSGILIIKNNIYPKDLSPTHGGGGTVSFVNDNIIVYEDNIMNREQSGTPGIMQMIKAALSFQVKDLLIDIIHQKELKMQKQFFNKFKGHKKLIILGPQDYYNRVGIVSFTIKHNDRLLHSNFLVKLLSDLFGIQARSGCSCAGPYGHKLLNINETISLELLKWIKGSDKQSLNFEGVKFGWGRINLHYSLQQDDINYIMDSLEFISLYGYKFLIFYYFNVHTGEWIHKNELNLQSKYSLNFNILLKDKLYAKSEQDRILLMQQHLNEAYQIANSIQPFELDQFKCLGNIAYFYAAKGNVLNKSYLKQKQYNMCKDGCSIKKFQNSKQVFNIILFIISILIQIIQSQLIYIIYIYQFILFFLENFLIQILNYKQ